MYLMCIKRVVNLSTKQKLNSVFCADDMDVSCKWEVAGTASNTANTFACLICTDNCTSSHISLMRRRSADSC